MPRSHRTASARTAAAPTGRTSSAGPVPGGDTAPKTDPTPDTDDWGIDLRWVDADDKPHTIADVVVERLRSVIGKPPDDLDRTAPLVLRPGDSLAGLPGLPGGGAELDVVCEDGSRRRIAGSVPEDFPLGYHRVTTTDGVGRSMIVSPGRCWLPDGWRAWGWTVQLYAVRSESSWGFGDLGDLGSIREWAHEAGAGFLLINPLHAVAPTFPQEPSPYLPASRRFRNPLYLRVEDVPGAEDVDLADVRTAGRALTGEPLIDRDGAWRLKRAALRRIFDATAAAGAATRDHDPGPDTDSGATDFASYRAAAGQPLEEFATWCALADEYGLDFHDWPADLHRPEGAAVARFRSENEPAISFHAWLQWLLDRQLRASTRGMTVLQDLPIGVDGGGADAWAWQDQLADGIRIGAPPDLFNSRGQNWGSPPLIPWRMRASDYAAFIASIRATMAATGGLRIDHVMGLFRLWWLPADGSPADGAYVRYPSADLLNIVALESHRAQAIVVGEDLGTVEPGVRERLAEHAVLSYTLLLFEDGKPEQWPVQSMAAITTHDLPTVAGLWSGADLAEQLSYGSGAEESLIAGAAELSSRLRPAEIDDSSTGAASALGRSRSSARLRSAGGVEAAVEGAHELLGRSPATLLSATLEDAVAEPRRPNMPGVAARPNWCLPLPVRVEDLPAHPTATAIARTLNAAVQRPSPDPTQGGPESKDGVPGPTQGGPESNDSTQGRPESGGVQGGRDMNAGLAGDPVAALRRIGFLLERNREPTYRVKAFRGAAAVLEALPEGELAARVAAGTLQELKGVGDKTAAVILQAANGQTPDYLAKLEVGADQPVTSGGAALRAALRGDLHTHSDWSDGGSPIAEMARTARDLGHEYMVLTDHSPRLTVANGLSPQRLMKQLDVVAALNDELAPFRILTGIEVDILDNGALDQTDELLARLDVVVASVHSKLKMAHDAMTVRMCTAVANQHTDVLGHCTGRLVTGERGQRGESQFDPELVLTACTEFGVAVEINSRPERLDPPRRLLRMAVEMGCEFSIDTDAHAPGQLDWQPYGCERAEECGVAPESIINTRTADDLLAWTGRDR